MSSVGSSQPKAAVAAEALARRSRVSALAYALLAILVMVSIAPEDQHAVVSSAYIAAMLCVSLSRIVLALRQPRMYSVSPRRWQLLFRLGTLSAALVWGSGAALLVTVGTAQTVLIALVTTAGIVAGATTSLCPDLPLLRVHMTCMLVPTATAVAVRGGVGSSGIATIIVIYWVYLQVQAKQQHRDFFEALASAQLAEARSVALAAASAEAQRALATADSANRAKSEFLANMSHELRTPLTAVIGYAELLLGSDDHHERIEYAETIRRNGEHLLHLLNDILDLSKIEAEKMTVTSEPFEIGPVISDVESLMRVRASDRGLAFEVALDTAIPTRMTGDSQRLRQILLNLVGNAIKFTSSGRVELRIRYEAPAPSAAQGHLVIDVIDTGEGISPEAQARLFAPFSQVDGSAKRSHQGTGLGLYISRTFARMMGGEIALESTLGGGSKFSLRLPIETTDRTPFVESIHPAMGAREYHDTASGMRLDAVRVLLAEDGIDNQRLVTAILRRAGAAVDLADNGLIALRRALNAPVDRPYDVVLMDMDMAELDGYGATARLRAAGYQKPIVALTAHAMQAHRDRALAAGCNEHLTKPIDRAVLLDTVARLAGRPGGQPHESVVSAPQPAAPTSPVVTSAPIEPIFSTLADDEDIAALLPGFCESLREFMGKLSTSVEHDDRAALARLAHQLAGAGGSYGFAAITTEARKLEVGLRAGSSDVAPHVAALVRLCEGVLAAYD
jgi:signal transduction histidine kinase/HPt (histidine-containing phosphotransfer) domain-containing protein/ActR/RegA family two-component response regulator